MSIRSHMNLDKQEPLRRIAAAPRLQSLFHAATLAALTLCQGSIADAHAADALKPSEAINTKAADITGHYHLKGVHEAVAELVLRPNGRFQFGMAYGAVDLSAEGTWEQQSQKVVLTADAKPPPSFKWKEGQPAHDERCFDGSDAPTALMVCIRTPEVEMVWRGIEITAEFANGQRRSGTTGTNGKLLFVARDEPQWKGVPVQRIQVAAPGYNESRQWFDVPQGADTAVIHLEAGYLIQPAFKAMTLHIVSSPKGQPELVELRGDGREVLRYVRR